MDLIKYLNGDIMSYRKSKNYLPFVLSAIMFPVYSYAAMTSGTLNIINDLHSATDTVPVGASAIPVLVKIYAAAGTASAPCDTVTNLASGATYASVIGTAGKCAGINHFTMTPLSSTTHGRMFPYGSTAIDTTVVPTSSVVTYIVTDTGAGTAGTDGVLLNGIYTPYTDGAAAGSGDTSIPPAFDPSGILKCTGTALVKLLPTEQ